MAEIRFYLDENLDLAIAEQLKRRGIDVVTVRDVGRLGNSDVNHLKRATEMGQVLCTQDDDFLRMAAEGMEHAGIVFHRHHRANVGVWVRALVDLHTFVTAKEMVNHVEFV